jgi:hypothetical protein
LACFATFLQNRGSTAEAQRHCLRTIEILEAGYKFERHLELLPGTPSSALQVRENKVQMANLKSAMGAIGLEFYYLQAKKHLGLKTRKALSLVACEDPSRSI